MVEIDDKNNCCGCSACASICPRHCIIMVADNEGFLYPQVDKVSCIDCGLCEKVCNHLHPYDMRNPIKVLAAVNKDESIRIKSSSGGVFYVLAQKVINEGGVVFGARFDGNWQVVIDYAEDIEGVRSFMGSKYVQARIDNAYIDARRFLQEGRMVLFSGTPCQVAGLHKFLRKSYNNLLTVDFICHGTPSPKVWGLYLNEITKGIKNLNNVEFRSKAIGWKNFSMSLDYTKSGGEVSYVSPMTKDLYMRAFLHNLILRPSCHDCKANGCSSQSDITIADFWGVQFIKPEMDDDKGASLVLVHSHKAEAFLQSEHLSLATVDFDNVKSYNTAVHSSSKPHTNRSMFFERLGNEPLFELITECVPISMPSFIDRCKGFLKRKFKNIKK